MSAVFYHRTTPQAAEDIMANGFRDSTGSYLTVNEYTGVWLSDVPLTSDYAISLRGEDDVFLAVTLPGPREDLAEYEWVEEDPDTGEPAAKGYREWLVPAEKINGSCVLDLLGGDEAFDV